MNTPLLVNGSLWINLKLALEGLETYLKERIFPKDLTFLQWYTLRILYLQETPPAISEVAQMLGKKNSSFTHVVDKLQAKGYIDRIPDKTDRRITHLVLRDEAKQIRKQFLENAEQIEAELSLHMNISLEGLWQALQLLQQFVPKPD